MSAGPLTVNVSARVAWWVRPYLFAIRAMVFVTRRAPNFERLDSVIKRGVELEIK